MEENSGSEAPEACDLDSHILGELAGEIQSDRAVDRMHAVSVLGRFGTGPGALEALKHMTSDDPDHDVRRQARQSYDKLKARVVAPLASEMRVRTEGEAPKLDLVRLKKFINVANPIYRIEAVLQALDTRDKAALPDFLERLTREKDEWVVATLIRAIGVIGDASHIPMIVPYLEWEAHPRVISNSVEALGNLDVQTAAKDIARMVDHRDPRVQAAAVMALYKIERDAARVCLQAMARSTRTGARSAAAHCLAKLRDPECLTMLKQMATDEPDPELKVRFQDLLLATGRNL